MKKQLFAAFCAVFSMISLAAEKDLLTQFREAYDGGSILVADRIFRQIEQSPEKDKLTPADVYKAAEVARNFNNGVALRDRYMFFDKLEQKWTPQVEYVNWWLCEHGGNAMNAKIFARLADNVKANDKLFWTGCRLLDRLRDGKRGEEYVGVAEKLFEKFGADMGKRQELMTRLFNFYRDTRESPGFPHGRACELWMKYPCYEHNGWKEWSGWYGDNFDWMIRFVEMHAKADNLLPPGNMWDRISNMSNIKDAEAQKKLDVRLSAVKGEVLRLKAGWHYYKIMEQALRRPWNYYPGLEDEALSKAILADLVAGAPYYDTGIGQNLSWWAVNDYRRIDGVQMWELMNAIPNYFYVEHCGRWAEQACSRAKSFEPMKQLLAKMGKERAQYFLWNCLDWVRHYDPELALQVIRNHVYMNTIDFDYDRIYRVLNCDAYPLEKRCQFLCEIVKLSGCPWRFGERTAMNPDYAKHWYKWLNDAKLAPYTNAVAQLQKAGYHPADNISQLRGWLNCYWRGDANLADTNAHQVAERFVKLFQGKTYPKLLEGMDWKDAPLVNGFINRYWDMCIHNYNSRAEYVRSMMGFFGPGCDWQHWWRDMWQDCWRADDKRVTGGDYCWLGRVYESKTRPLPGLMTVGVGPQAKEIGAEFPVDKFSSGELYEFIRCNWNRNEPAKSGFSEPLMISMVSKLWARAEKDHGIYGWWETMDWIWDIVNRRDDKGNMPYTNSIPWEAVAKGCLDTGSGDWNCVIRFINFSGVVGKKDEYSMRMAQSIAKSTSPYDQIRRAGYMTRNNSGLCVTKAAAELIYGEVLPKALKSIPDADAPQLDVSLWGQSAGGAFNYMADNYGGKVRDAYNNVVLPELYRLQQAGMRGLDDRWPYYYAACAYDRAAAAKDEKAMAKAATLAIDWGHWSNDWAESRMSAARKAEQWQILYLMASNLGEWSIRDSLRVQAGKWRAEAATKLPGIYPVGEKHPAYPLYVAADEMNRNNQERAWELLQKSIDEFERSAASLPPDFVAWGLEQLRLSRGRNDSLLLRARTIATKLMQSERVIIPMLAAACIYTRAESFRDQQNFEAAKLEYDTIRNNATYSSTPYGRKALFRNVDLMIQMGNQAGAEQIIEYWLSQPDVEIQTQAHYFAAKIAFDRQEYDACVKELKKVFETDFTHTEARFLHGQWKLATNHEVDETDVQVGSLSDRKIIRPGQQLTITVQDRNLSVAGGGASIPVIVKTNPGGDYEYLQLYPSSRDPTLFRGVLEVKLAAPVVSNMLLEVSGQDIVSYQVDPAFAKARALESTPPKELTIVDDGLLLMGTGAPRTDGSNTVSALTKAIEAGATSVGGENFASSLRPGNPIYIAVKDLDRSFGGSNGTVTVELGTSSGDIVPELQLKETKPYSGIFRGSIPTALPPPRAYASDSAAGSNPGDIINSTRDGVWTSVADGKPGKWFAVDTMGSHVVSNCTITMRTPKEIKTIRIAGSLTGEPVSLGSIPAGKVEDRDGLRIQKFQESTDFRQISDLRTRFADGAKNRPDAVKTDALKFTGDYKDARGRRWIMRIAGAFERPADIDYLRLRVKGKAGLNGALRSLRMFVLCDGDQVFAGEGLKLDGETFNVECSKDVHLLEVYAQASGACDDFEIVQIDREGEEQPFDMTLFDREKHPEITKFLEDAAIVTRTETGFTATFRKQVRLRRIRWEFGDVVSPDVQASALTLMDVKKKMILPVKSDFSDAQRNNTLEVAPGDTIYCKYRDDVTANGQKRVLQQSLFSSFNNGSIGLYYETIGQNMQRTLFGARRFRPGDKVIVQVRDPDADVSPGRDKVQVRIKANSGTEKVITLVEDADGRSGEGQCHSGVFTGLVRTQLNTETNVTAKMLIVSPEDVLTVEYEDRENTSPGVPTVRTAKINAVQPTDHSLTLFQVRSQRVVDSSAAAASRLAALRRRSGNESISAVYTTRTTANAMTDEEVEKMDGEIPMNIACPIPVRVTCLGRAIHDGSSITVEATAESEIARAEEDGEEPFTMRIPLKINGGVDGAELKRGYMTGEEAWKVGAFAGSIPLELGGGASDDMFSSGGHGSGKRLQVTGSDRIRIRVLGEDGEPVIERWLKLVSNGSIALMDSTWTAERTLAHVGEKLYVTVKDEDRDESSDADEIIITAKSTVSGVERNVVLSETLPHSGVFTGSIRPILFPTNDVIPVAVTSLVDDVETLLKEDRFSVKYGDSIVFTYNDENFLPDTISSVYSVTGMVHKGADGKVRLFSKRFRSNDEAVLVQFRLAECLFEQAKDFRKLKQKEKSAAAIDEGKYLLEEALKNYPDSKHAVQGEYLLANLYQELAAEQVSAAGKDPKEIEKAMETARPLYTEALARFSVILSTWPDSELAPRAQYHKALCLEKLEDFTRSGEEYVKMTYLYPSSELVGDATIRLASYYYQREKRYDTAAKIYASFAKRFPNHEKAAKCLFMSGSCFVKQAEEIQKAAEARLSEEAKKNPRYQYRASQREKDLYKEAVASFDMIHEKFRDTVKPELRAQAMYWAGDASFRRADYPGAYLRLKRCVFEFPETEWARRARGLLLQEAPSFESLGQ